MLGKRLTTDQILTFNMTQSYFKFESPGTDTWPFLVMKLLVILMPTVSKEIIRFYTWNWYWCEKYNAYLYTTKMVIEEQEDLRPQAFWTQGSYLILLTIVILVHIYIYKYIRIYIWHIYIPHIYIYVYIIHIHIIHILFEIINILKIFFS